MLTFRVAYEYQKIQTLIQPSKEGSLGCTK